jgi:hypothetical protein
MKVLIQVTANIYAQSLRGGGSKEPEKSASVPSEKVVGTGTSRL